MKRLKLYEQYDFEDLSDEELFGKEEEHPMGIFYNDNDYYIVEKILYDINRVYLYKDFNWCHINYLNEIMNRENSPSINDVPDDGIINVYNNGRWIEFKKIDLPEEIKKRLK